MGFLENIKQNKEENKIKEQQYKLLIRRHPEFTVQGVKKCELIPVDGNVDRMLHYGLYKGDKIIIDGETHNIAKDDKHHLIFIPKETGSTRLYYDGNYWENGDRISDGTMTYVNRTREYEVDSYNGHCLQTEVNLVAAGDINTPSRNVVIQGRINGHRVNSIDLTGCKHITHIAHLPERLVSRGILKDTSLTELPENLKDATTITTIRNDNIRYSGSVAPSPLKEITQTSPNHLAYYLGVYAAVRDEKDVIEMEMAQHAGKIQYHEQCIEKLKEERDNAVVEYQKLQELRDKVQGFLDGEETDIENVQMRFFVNKQALNNICTVTIKGTEYIYKSSQNEFVSTASQSLENFGTEVKPAIPISKIAAAKQLVQELDRALRAKERDIDDLKYKIARSEIELKEFIKNERAKITKEVTSTMAEYRAKTSQQVGDSVLNGDTAEMPSVTNNGNRNNRNRDENGDHNKNGDEDGNRDNQNKGEAR